jgi:cytochrome c oxidase subunit 5a
LERGLNHIFAADWVPSVDVVEEALRASRRLNCFATGVRVLEALEDKVDDKKVYQQYQSALRPLVEELGLVWVFY